MRNFFFTLCFSLLGIKKLSTKPFLIQAKKIFAVEKMARSLNWTISDCKKTSSAFKSFMNPWCYMNCINGALVSLFSHFDDFIFSYNLFKFQSEYFKLAFSHRANNFAHPQKVTAIPASAVHCRLLLFVCNITIEQKCFAA